MIADQKPYRRSRLFQMVNFSGCRRLETTLLMSCTVFVPQQQHVQARALVLAPVQALVHVAVPEEVPSWVEAGPWLEEVEGLSFL